MPSYAPPPSEAQPSYPPVPAQPLYTPQPSFTPPPKKKNMALRIALIAAGALVLVIVAVNVISFIILRANKDKTVSTVAPTPSASVTDSVTPAPTPDVAEVPPEDTSMNTVMNDYFKDIIPFKASFTADDVLYPSMYNSLTSLVTLNAQAPNVVEALLTVEIQGFTHKFEKNITITPLGVNLQVLPAMLDGALDNCNTARKMQLHVTLTDNDTGKSYINETKDIALQSMYDIQFVNDAGTKMQHANICAWITPEDPIIRTWQRDATDVLSKYSDGAVQQFVGYQGSADDTLYQVMALYDTLANVYKVRYNMTSVTTSGNGANQRIALPAQVIDDRSGLCVETAVTMASATEALGFNTYVAFLPGHAMTLIELQDQSTEYLLIETIALTFGKDFKKVLTYGSADDMYNLLSDKGVFYLVNVQSERKNGIRPMK